MDKSQRNESRYSTLSRFQSDGLADVAVPVILACMSQRCLNFLVILVLFLLPASAQHSSYQYFRIGQKSEAQTNPTAGYALMGGGKDLDAAFRWLCQRANGGDFVILRAADDDSYNTYVNGLCKVNSVATLIIPDRNAAEDSAVSDVIGHAEAVFIAGGDQAHYIRAWQMFTPVPSFYILPVCFAREV